MRKLIALVAAALVATAIALTATAFAKTVSIGVTDNAFSKSSLTIRQGTSLHWKWATENEHNIHSTKRPSGAKKVHSGDISTTGDYTYKFRKAGKYRLICENHPFDMVTKVTVKPTS
jgi:plastocyanin